jgi:CRISPR/Cas system-associated exonuclease Cas4 (RecB family)
MKGPRLLSFSEIQTAMSCWAAWDYRYGGRLAGSTLKRKSVAAVLSNGRAWGAAVAAWHAAPTPFDLFHDSSPMLARWVAHQALRRSIERDVADSIERSVWVGPESEAERTDQLAAILDHYCSTAEKLPNLTRLEGELMTPIPSRSGRRASTRYRFHGFLDGFSTLENGEEWLVEFKFRSKLSARNQVELSRQVKWYAWAYQQIAGRPVAGVFVDERLNEAPKPARIVKGHKKGTFTPSHDKAQMTTPENYIALCQEFDVKTHDDVVESLRARDWQRRHRVSFRQSELEEAGRELTSSGLLIGALDRGEFYPVRNAKPGNCSNCDFKAICANPRDTFYVDTLYDRGLPKRDREPLHQPATERPSVPHSAGVQ